MISGILKSAIHYTSIAVAGLTVVTVIPAYVNRAKETISAWFQPYIPSIETLEDDMKKKFPNDNIAESIYLAAQIREIKKQATQQFEIFIQENSNKGNFLTQEEKMHHLNKIYADIISQLQPGIEDKIAKLTQQKNKYFGLYEKSSDKIMKKLFFTFAGMTGLTIFSFINSFNAFQQQSEKDVEQGNSYVSYFFMMNYFPMMLQTVNVLLSVLKNRYHADEKIIRMVQDLGYKSNVSITQTHLYNVNKNSGFYYNAFADAFGQVSISKGLINEFSDKQLKAIIAHEFGHIANEDTITLAYVGILAGLNTNYAFSAFNLPFALGVAFLGQYGYCNIIQCCELYADQFSAKLTEPRALSRSLEKLYALGGKKELEFYQYPRAYLNKFCKQIGYTTHPSCEVRQSYLRDYHKEKKAFFKKERKNVLTIGL